MAAVRAAARHSSCPGQHHPPAPRPPAPQVAYASCSESVMRVMGPDTMRSAAHLVDDVLAQLPLLLYQVRRASGSLAC